MADSEDDVLDLTEELETDLVDEQEDEQSVTDTGDAGDDEETVGFGDEAAPASGEAESGLVKHLREQIRERDRRLAATDRVVAKPTVEDPGPEPDYDQDADGSKWGFDHTAWKRDWLTWQDKKTAHQASVTEAEKAQRQTTEAWNNELAAHAEKRKALKFRDVQEAEDVVTATLSDVQQAVIVKAAENSALFVYALGKHPAKLAELSKITDPLKLAAAVARLEGKVTVAKRGGPPEPERIARGSASVETGSSDKTLAKLEKEADRTGDSSALIAYRSKLKAQAKK